MIRDEAALAILVALLRQPDHTWNPNTAARMAAEAAKVIDDELRTQRAAERASQPAFAPMQPGSLPGSGWMR